MLAQIWSCADSAPLLPNAKLAEDHVEKIFRGRLADDFADGIDGDTEIQGGEFERRAGAQRRDRAQRGVAAAVERVLMARVDHGFQHLGLDFTRPGEVLYRVFERLDSLAG